MEPNYADISVLKFILTYKMKLGCLNFESFTNTGMQRFDKTSRTYRLCGSILPWCEGKMLLTLIQIACSAHRDEVRRTSRVAPPIRLNH